jgi:hypothetical protein
MSESNGVDLSHTIEVVQIDEEGMSYETNEFVVRYDPAASVWYAGSDGGCSCYDGFDDANLERVDSVGELRRKFSGWITGWHDGVGREAAAWDKFNEAIRSVKA